MKAPIFLLAALFLLGPRGAFAQIKLDESGNVGVGVSPVASVALWTIGEDESDAYGVWSTARRSSSDTNVGVYARAYNSSSVNIGLRGKASDGSTAYGVVGLAYGASTNYAGYFSGDVHVTGALTEASDAMFKRDVQALGGKESAGNAPVATHTLGSASTLQEDRAPRSRPGRGGEPRRSQARAKLLALRPVKYHFRRSAYEEMGFPGGEQFGLVAQEVEAVLPELVSESVHPGAEEIGEGGEIVETGAPLRYKSVNYLQLVPLLVQTVKEQQAEIDALRTELQALARDDG